MACLLGGGSVVVVGAFTITHVSKGQASFVHTSVIMSSIETLLDSESESFGHLIDTQILGAVSATRYELLLKVGGLQIAYDRIGIISDVKSSHNSVHAMVQIGYFWTVYGQIGREQWYACDKRIDDRQPDKSGH
jgi:hypothetical protein